MADVNSKEAMKSIELLSTGIRLLGIYVFLYSIRVSIYQYQAIIQFKSSSQDDVATFIYLGAAQFICLFVASIIMFKFPVSVSSWILPKTKVNEPVFNGTSQDIEISFFIIIGVYILSWSMPDLLNNAIWLWYIKSSGNLGFGVESKYIINEVVTVVEISVGLYLCLQAKGLSALIRSFRQVGAK